MRSLQRALVAAAFLGLPAAASAFSISSAGPGTDQGTYFGSSFTVNDPLQTVTGTNDCAVGNCFLQEWTWTIGITNPGSLTSAGNLFLDVYDITAGNVYLGSSSNSVDVLGTVPDLGTATWNFANLAIDPTHVHIVEISFDDAAGNAAQIRLRAQPDNVAGNLTVANGAIASPTFDAIYTAVLVPEPGTLALLTLGLAGLCVSSRRPRES